MEKLLHYVWKHKLFPLKPLTTDSGETLEVIDPGQHNQDAGPDFFNAKLKRNGTLWVGNVEIHDKASDWFRHGHQLNAAYDNVVLHVVRVMDAQVKGTNGVPIPQLQLDVPPQVKAHYEALMRNDALPPCHEIVPTLSSLMLSGWMGALQYERLNDKAKVILNRLQLLDGDWERTCFVTLARSFGFGINGDAFEEWARVLSFRAAGRIRDDAFQLEALFFGQAGLLGVKAEAQPFQQKAVNEVYLQRLQKEYAYLSHVYELPSMDPVRWRFLRLRPQNFPHVRLSQLVHLYHTQQMNFSMILEAKTAQDVRNLLTTEATVYWQTHYAFGAESAHSLKRLTEASLRLLTINAVAPLLYAYGVAHGKEELCERAVAFWEQTPAENNRYTRLWKECGLAQTTAADSQAVIQLHTHYCQRKDCLRCRIGYEYLKRMK